MVGAGGAHAGLSGSQPSHRRNFGRFGGGVRWERPATVARELIKRFKEIHNASLSELEDWLDADPHRRKGEFVVIVQGAPAASEADTAETRRLLVALLVELPASRAAAVAAKVDRSAEKGAVRSGIGVGERFPSFLRHGGEVRQDDRSRMVEYSHSQAGLAKRRPAVDTKDWEPAGRSLYRMTIWRKVRAPQDGVPGNAWAA